MALNNLKNYNEVVYGINEQETLSDSIRNVQKDIVAVGMEIQKIKDREQKREISPSESYRLQALELSKKATHFQKKSEVLKKKEESERNKKK